MKKILLKSLDIELYYCGYDTLGVKVSHREDLKDYTHLNFIPLLEQEENASKLLHITKKKFAEFKRIVDWQLGAQEIKKPNDLWVNCIKAAIILYLLEIDWHRQHIIYINDIRYDGDGFFRIQCTSDNRTFDFSVIKGDWDYMKNDICHKLM